MVRQAIRLKTTCEGRQPAFTRLGTVLAFVHSPTRRSLSTTFSLTFLPSTPPRFAMMKQASRIRSFFPAVLVVAVALFFNADAVHAQSSGQPAYAQDFKEAKEMGRQARQLEKSENLEEAVAKYEAAYRQMAKVAEAARKEGSVQNTNLAKQYAAQFAFLAGRLLHNNDQSQAAIAHFEFGQQIAPPSYTKNTTGLRAARNSMKPGLAEASVAVRDENYRQALRLLSELDEQNGTSYFYQALAHQGLGNSESAIAYAGRALDTGEVGTSKRRRLYLAIGEEQMKLGDNEAALESLAKAADLGSDRATALMEQL